MEFRSYTLNGVTTQATPRRASSRNDKKYERTVRYKGDERTVHYGEPGEQMERDVPESRDAFLSRHNCDEKSDPFAPGFWACYDWKNPDEKRIAFGKSVKAVGQGKIEGYLVYFTSPDEKDLTGEYFTKDTNFYTDDFPLDNTPTLYHHGLDLTLGVKAVGRVVKSEVDDVGIWVQAQLNMRDEYERMIYELTEKGAMGWSSGALPQSVQVAPDGRIKSWAIIEASLTPTPAMPIRTQITTLKALYEAIEGENPKEQKNTPELKSDTQNIKSKDNLMNAMQAKRTIKMQVSKELAQMLTAVAEMLATEMNAPVASTDMEEIQEELVLEASQMVEEEVYTDKEYTEDELSKMTEDELNKMTEDELNKMTEDELNKMSEDDEMKRIKKSVETVFRKNRNKWVKQAVDHVQTKRENNARKYRDATREAIKGAMNKPAKSRKQDAGSGVTKGYRLSVSENLKYAHLSAEEMALGIKLLGASFGSNMPENVRNRLPLKTYVEGGYVSEEYLNTLAAKAVHTSTHETPTNDRLINLDRAALKSVMPFKANELDATDITNQGQEWVSVFYDTRLWERARDRTELFNKLTEKGMRTVDIPQKSNSMNIKLNTSSPKVFTRNEANSTDATGNPEVTAQITPWGTDEVEKIAQQHVLATTYTHELEEDSIIDIVQFLNGDMVLTLSEATESTLINGDTTATANTNINLIDGTPPSGLQKPDYLAWDGIRHQFLVDNTSQSTDASGALEATDYENTIMLFPSPIVNRRNEMLFIVDYKTESQTRRLPELLTVDVAGESRATLFAGNIPPLFNVEVYMSGLLGLSDATGKISATPGNNTKGTLICVYAPYWQYGRKRAVTIEADRNILAGATTFVASIRHILAARGANAANGTYNITV